MSPSSTSSMKGIMSGTNRSIRNTTKVRAKSYGKRKREVKRGNKPTNTEPGLGKDSSAVIIEIPAEGRYNV